MVLSLPANLPIQSVRFGLKTNTQLFISPLSGDTQAAELPGARWFSTYTLAPKKRSEEAAVQAFLVALSGASGTFYGYDPAGVTPLGTPTGTPRVNGDDQVGSSLITDGWTNSTLVLKAGDYFTVNSEYKMVTADVTSNGSGQATISFKPNLRSSPADNDNVVVTNPTCIMRLLDDDQAAWDVNVAQFYDITFSAVETFFS